ncbi:hypothetical protein CVN56_31405 [Rhodococcus sp. AQ5-07]|nr:hypothetical protein CVN56_31405 [Rhodococcus sp. AQ5-07]
MSELGFGIEPVRSPSGGLPLYTGSMLRPAGWGVEMCFCMSLALLGADSFVAMNLRSGVVWESG